MAFWIFGAKQDKIDALSKEIQKLREDIKRIDGDVDQVFSAVNSIKIPRYNDSPLKKLIFNVQDKVTKVYDATRLAIQNHERLDIIEEKLENQQKPQIPAKVHQTNGAHEERTNVRTVHFVRLTPLQQNIHNVLWESNIPLTVKQISEKIDVSPGSVRARMNEMKKKGVGIESVIAKNKKKAYSLSADSKYNVLSQAH